MEWLDINKLSLNKNKSKYVTFQMPRKVKHTFSLNISNINTERVEEFILGLTLDANLNWTNTLKKYQTSVSKLSAC